MSMIKHSIYLSPKRARLSHQSIKSHEKSAHEYIMMPCVACVYIYRKQRKVAYKILHA